MPDELKPSQPSCFPFDMLVALQRHAATQLSESTTCHAAQLTIVIAGHQVLVRTISVFAM